MSALTFLIAEDYSRLAKGEQLAVLCGGEANIGLELARVEKDAIQEVSSYLNSRYVLTKTFPGVNRYAVDTAYLKDDLVYISATAWAAGIYAVKALVSNGGFVYRCIQATTNQATSDPAYWLKLGNNKAFYSVVADVAANVVLTNATYWLEGDTRAELIVRHVMNIALYELHGGINPRTIPEYRVQRRDDSIKWLKLVANAKNNINADFLTLITYETNENGTKKSNNITWGSQPSHRGKY